MSSFLKKLSKIDDKTKYGVYGWIRKAEQELRCRHIPLMISNICVLYYYPDEIFQIVSKSVKISDDGKSVIKIANDKWWNNTNYGINEIASNTNNKYQWDFRMKHLEFRGVMIGIMNSKQICVDKYFYECDAKRVTYAVYGGGKTYDAIKQEWPWGLSGRRQFKQDDKISMILDLNTSKLTFVINDKIQINAYDNVPKSDHIKYKMFVSLIHKNDCVQIMSFSSHLYS